MSANEVFRIPKYNLTIYGQSRGSQNTGFYIPELKMLLDTQTRMPCDAEIILVTHNHTDHCFSLPMRLTHISSKPIILVPKETQEFFVDFVNACGRLERCDKSYESPYKMIGVTEEDIFLDKCTIRTYKLDHSVPCRGYGIIMNKTKLKKEYGGLTKHEIIKLKRSDIIITEKVSENVLVYLTDTTTKIFDTYPELTTYKNIIVECTFFPLGDGDKEMILAIESKHTHWNDLYPIMKRNPNINFILIHFSNRYTVEDLMRFKSGVMEKNIFFVI